MNAFVVILLNLQLYILDIQVKRIAELKTNHNMMMSWIRWWVMLNRSGTPKCMVRMYWEITQLARLSTPTSGRTSMFAISIVKGTACSSSWKVVMKLGHKVCSNYKGIKILSSRGRSVPWYWKWDFALFFLDPSFD